MCFKIYSTKTSGVILDFVKADLQSILRPLEILFVFLVLFHVSYHKM